MSYKTIASILCFIVIILLIVIGFTIFAPSSKALGSQVQNDLYYFTGGISVDPTGYGNTLTVLRTASVSCTGPTVGATTTVAECPATGVKSGDKIFVSSPTGITAGWTITGGYASTTANGYIEVRVQNLTGVASAIPPATATTSIPVLITR